MKAKFNKSLILKRAWKLYRNQEVRTMEQFGLCLSESWRIAKESVSSLDFDKLYKDYKAVILNYVQYKLTQPLEVAEEVTNDTFVKAMQNIAYFDESRTKLVTWLMRIAYRITIDGVRTNHRKHFANVDDIVNDDSVSFIEAVDDITPISNIETSEAMTEIQMAMSSLSEKKQNIMSLVIKGHSYKDIASILEMPLNSVCVTVQRCRKDLAKVLNVA